jgi:hypothetical protein
MISLATIGFMVGAVLFAWYGSSLKPYAVSASISRFYPWAYYLLAMTFLLWGGCGNERQPKFSRSIGLGRKCFCLNGKRSLVRHDRS